MASSIALAIAALHGSAKPRRVVLLDQEHNSLPFERISCPDLRYIGEAWLAMPCEAGEPIPRWSAFRHSEFKAVISKLCVLTAEDWRADRIEFTLYGGHPTEYIGGGKPLSMQELRDDPLRSANYYDIRDRAGRAIDNSAPQYVKKTLSWDDQAFIEYEVLMLPFMPDKGVQRILQPVSAWIET